MHDFILLVMLLMTSGVLSSYNPFRLPNAIKPDHYDLRILTHLDGPDQLRFEGQVKIHFHVLEKTKNITLHAKNLTINDSQITLSSQADSNCITKVELNEQNEFYIMHLCEILQRDEHYELSIPFKGPLNGNDTGYYWSSYNDSRTEPTHYMAVTQFSPTFARLAFPCFDEPHLKATFRVTLGYHKNYTGHSNTPVSKCEAHETLVNYVWCEHEPLFRTSTYLVAYAVHSMTSVLTRSSDTVQNVTFRSWMQPKAVQDSDFSVDFAPKTLRYLEQLMEVRFPLRKIDQLVVPTHQFRAMENWGLVTFKESVFVHNDNVEPQENNESKALTIAHEYAHQWFGNLVTMKWWNDLWLKEGPSTYFAYLTLDALMPEWGSGQRSIAKELTKFFQMDALNDTIDISRPVQDSKSILKQFSTYVYEKGALTMRMLHKLLGDDVFFLGIRSYLQQHAYDNVFQSDLWQAMQQAADEKRVLPAEIRLSTVMNSWTLQMGYPIVSVSRDYDIGSVRINQTRFWLPDGRNDHPQTCWWIPLTFVNQQHVDFEQTQPQFWMECPTIEMTLQLPNKPNNDEWIILNPQVTTIYRVNYDERNWRLIMNTLNTAENFRGIHELNRAQLIDDLMALAWINMQSYELALTMLEYLPREQQLLPWNRVFDVFNNFGYLLRGEQSKVFRRFMKNLVTPLYERCPKLDSIQIRTRSSESIALYRLAYAQACRYGVDDCIEQAVSLSLENNEAKVPVNFRDIVYCSSIENGNDVQFQLFMQLFQNSTVEPKQLAWATALGCTRNFTQLQQFLDYLIQTKITTTSSFYIQAVSSALRQGHVALDTTNHILKHAKVINDKFSAKNIKQLPLTLIVNHRSSAEDEELKQLLKGLNKFEQPLKNAFEMRNVNLHWLIHRSTDFIGALSKYL